MTEKTLKFIGKSQLIHGNFYDYSLVEYKGVREKVIIICPKHGEFEQTPENHLGGSGCQKCGKEKYSKSLRLKLDEFLKRAIELHGDFYDYSLVEYINSKTKVIIICPIHGKFEQRPDLHIFKSKPTGCPKCAKNIMTLEEFKNKGNIVHKRKYIYDNIKEYKHSESKVEIICPIHGVFLQTPHSHLNGSGCPLCFSGISKTERILNKLLKNWNIKNIILNDRIVLKPYELDLYLPNHNLAIEYCGLFWHSNSNREDNYHFWKYNECYKKGINLIQIFEDEWIYQKEKVIDKLKGYLNIQKDNVIDINQCIIEEYDDKEIFELLCFEEDNYLETDDLRHKIFDINIVLKHDNEIVSVLSLNKENENKYIITRFFDKLNYQIDNSFKTLLNWFIQNFKPSKILYLDNLRWSQEKLLLDNGFILDKLMEPEEYFLTKSNQNRLKQYNQNENLLLYKIFDAGKKIYIKEKINFKDIEVTI